MELKEKQRKILDVAVELFKEKGYMGSSVRDLATKLNIKAASLYAHIRSKEEILEWICFGIAQEFFDQLQEVKSTDISPKDKLNLFLDKHLSVVLKNRDVTHIYSNEWKHLEERLPEFVELKKLPAGSRSAYFRDLPGRGLGTEISLLHYTIYSSYFK